LVCIIGAETFGGGSTTGFIFMPKTKKKKRKEGMVFTEKILRGGSWYNTAYYINVGMRFKINPDIKLNSIGFRCAWDVQQ